MTAEPKEVKEVKPAAPEPKAKEKVFNFTRKGVVVKAANRAEAEKALQSKSKTKGNI